MLLCDPLHHTNNRLHTVLQQQHFHFSNHGVIVCILDRTFRLIPFPPLGLEMGVGAVLEEGREAVGEGGQEEVYYSDCCYNSIFVIHLIDDVGLVLVLLAVHLGAEGSLLLVSLELEAVLP